jgi:ABC-type transport system substrate-binding protein
VFLINCQESLVNLRITERPSTKWLLWLLPAAIAFGIFAACGGETTVVETVIVEKQVPGDTIVETVIVEKQVPGDTIVETVVVEKQVPGDTIVETVVVEKQVVVVATPTAIVSGGNIERPVPNTRLTLAVVDVGPRMYYGHQMRWPYNVRNANLGTMESLLIFDGENLLPSIASSFEIDNTGVTYTIRDDVPFHGGWGNVTAEDVAWSWNDTVKDGTLHTVAGNVSTDFSKFEVVDSNTVRMTFRNGPTIRWSAGAINGMMAIQSKAAYDAKGADWMLQNEVGTGPYTVRDHVADDRMLLDAVPNHWRQTGAYSQIDVIEVPEQSTRLAMLSTGQSGMAQVGVPFFKQATDITGVRIVAGATGGTTGSALFPSGQTYGNPDWPASIQLPWVGDPNDQASMESATKVRKALSYAIDRSGIIDAILSGVGCAQYQYRMDSCNPNYDQSLNTPYDVEIAKALLTEAGYPNGFDFDYYIPTGLNGTLEEVGEALVPMFEAIGLRPSVEKTAYSARRPEMLARTINDLWVFVHGDSVSPDALVAQMGELGGEGTWNMGIARPKSVEFRDEVLYETDFTEAWNKINGWQKWLAEEQVVVQAVTWRDAWALGPSVASWTSELHDAQWPPMVERIEVAKR